MMYKQILPLLSVFALLAAKANVVEGDGNEKDLKNGQEDEHVQLKERYSHLHCDIDQKPPENLCPAGHCLGRDRDTIDNAQKYKLTPEEIWQDFIHWFPDWIRKVAERDKCVKKQILRLRNQMKFGLPCDEVCMCFTGKGGSFKKFTGANCVDKGNGYEWETQTGYTCSCRRKLDVLRIPIRSLTTGSVCSVPCKGRP